MSTDWQAVKRRLDGVRRELDEIGRLVDAAARSDPVEVQAANLALQQGGDAFSIASGLASRLGHVLSRWEHNHHEGMGDAARCTLCGKDAWVGESRRQVGGEALRTRCTAARGMPL